MFTRQAVFVTKRIPLLSRPVVRLNSTYKSITKLTELKEFQSSISNGSQLSVIDFFATWCNPCKAMIPVISKLIKEHPEVTFYKVDVDESPEIAKHCNVTAMPTFVFAKDGKLLGTVVGANPAALEEQIEELK
ncbi:hypothetical protein NCAS_0D04790 [Naumovozyma castellii]|uniref:Thioredoxin domain-containing protein n=1 Tax=Naumovozyma castellii TaxID=27288 RepID=G0VER9_NAUCA|nr:hypothetical protein NCAS_0D04790 [Naumovozyma castellii CBS 4309]CCC70060.1 hypothetical protein NCAS_0D04790 [Naumovozyma castellii CBS 4309]